MTIIWWIVQTQFIEHDTEWTLVTAWQAEVYVYLLFFAFIRGITFFRAFENTRYFIAMVIEVIKDMKAFLVLLIYSCFAYAFLLDNIKEGSDI